MAISTTLAEMKIADLPMPVLVHHLRLIALARSVDKGSADTLKHQRKGCKEKNDTGMEEEDRLTIADRRSTLKTDGDIDKEDVAIIWHKKQ